MFFRIVRDDFRKIKADAIVINANSEPEIGTGIEDAIYEAAGYKRLMKARKKIGDIAVGEAAITKAFSLRAKYIIHTVIPKWKNGDNGSREVFRNCCESSLKLAALYRCKSIVFPIISTGSYVFPKQEALETALAVFRDYSESNSIEIILAVFDNELLKFSNGIFGEIDSYIDNHYVRQGFGEECNGIGATTTILIDYPGASLRPPKEQKKLQNIDTPCFGWGANGIPPKNQQDSEIARQSQISISRLNDVVSNISQTWQELLFRIIDEKGYTDTQVYKRANVDRKLFSKIRSKNDYQPKKNTAVAFALALELNIDQARDFLARAGYAFSPSSKFDLIVEFFIKQRVYDLYAVNLALFDHGEPLLGE